MLLVRKEDMGLRVEAQAMLQTKVTVIVLWQSHTNNGKIVDIPINWSFFLTQLFPMVLRTIADIAIGYSLFHRQYP